MSVAAAREGRLPREETELNPEEMKDLGKGTSRVGEEEGRTSCKDVFSMSMCHSSCYTLCMQHLN